MDKTREGRPESTVVVVTGGDPPGRTIAETLPAGSRVVAADSGADTALGLGLDVDELVGDLDSVSTTALGALDHAGVSIERHEADKDATDLELALTAALRHNPSAIVVLGGLGGRVDHELANLLLISSDVLAGVDVALYSGLACMHVVRPARPTTVCGTAGDVVSLMPMHGPARGVTASGVRWPLVGAELAAGTTLGVSNELLDHRATVGCTGGVLLVVQPGARAASIPPRTPSPQPSPQPSSQPPSPSSEVSHDR